jgi:hypothetical protein
MRLRNWLDSIMIGNSFEIYNKAEVELVEQQECSGELVTSGTSHSLC